MPGQSHDFMPDLENLIKTGKVQGTWPAARDEWGLHSSKLETVLLVEVPEQYRSADRVVPGRDDVYIIPQSSCSDGTLLCHSDTGRYYSNTHIKACLVLKPPDTIEGAATGGQRVLCTADYSHLGSMVDVNMKTISSDVHVSDELDETVFPPKVLVYTAAVARPVQGNAVQIHRMIERDPGSKKWLEDVARFKPAEMAAGLEAINKELLHAYTIAYVYTSRDNANNACSNMGLIATKSNGIYSLDFSLRSPAELGWQKHAGGHFRQTVAAFMDMAPNDVQTVIICGIPTEAIKTAGQSNPEKFTIVEHADNLKLLLPVQGDDAIYSSAHIAKIYALEPAALVEARRKLADVRTGAEGAKDDDPEELERTIQELILEAAAVATRGLDASTLPKPRESAEVAMLKRVIGELQTELEEKRRHSTVLEEVARASEEAGCQSENRGHGTTRRLPLRD